MELVSLADSWWDLSNLDQLRRWFERLFLWSLAPHSSHLLDNSTGMSHHSWLDHDTPYIGQDCQLFDQFAH
jgi:hypothetical protein